MLKKILLGTSLTLITSITTADNYMDAAWAKKACDAWNKNATLTTELSGETWAANNADRGYKLIQMYRTECGAATKVQLNIEDKDGKAMCTYGGLPDKKAVNPKVDYVMHAKDKHWTCMGSGKFGCGAMGAMGTGKLKFKGPKGEAMSVMGPFGAFLKLAGAVPGEKGSDHCPTFEKK